MAEVTDTIFEIGVDGGWFVRMRKSENTDLNVAIKEEQANERTIR